MSSWPESLALPVLSKRRVRMVPLQRATSRDNMKVERDLGEFRVVVGEVGRHAVQ